MAVLIAFLLGENSPFVGGPFHVADTVFAIVLNLKFLKNMGALGLALLTIDVTLAPAPASYIL